MLLSVSVCLCVFCAFCLAHARNVSLHVCVCVSCVCVYAVVMCACISSVCVCVSYVCVFYVCVCNSGVVVANQWIQFSVATPIQKAVALCLKQAKEPYEGKAK